MTWEEALAGLGTPDNWEPPHGLGPLPEGLAERAREVLALLAEQIRAVEDRLAQVQAELGALPVGTGAAGAEPPRFLDTHA